MTRRFIATFAAALSLSISTLACAPAFGAMPTLKPHHQLIKDCGTCHTAENAVAGNAFVVPNDGTCISCHGSYADLAKKTNELDEPNPHKSHHYGEGIACTACHKEHQPSKVYCNECHEFKYTIK